MLDLSTLNQRQKKIRRQYLNFSYQSGSTHLGSCLSAIDIIDGIYQVKKSDERFVLSNGHAAAAMYTILYFKKLIGEEVIKSLPVHPQRNLNLGIDVSTGSLGQGLPIALGMALANRQKNVYCLISDGECAEGSVWESLKIALKLNLANLKIVINSNGWGAYDPIESTTLRQQLAAFCPELELIDGHNPSQILAVLKKSKHRPVIVMAQTEVEQFPFLKGQDAHYHRMTEAEYQLALGQLR